MRSERDRLEHRIQRVFVLARDVDDELRAELARHVCILSSGLLEVACREILTEFARKRSSPVVAHYVSARLAQFRNPKLGRIYELLEEFDKGLADEVRRTVDEEVEAAVDSIVSNRNDFAHGRSSGLSLGTMQRYHRNAKAMISALERAFPHT